VLSDAERAAAIGELRRAAEEGRLDPRVLDARIGLVRAATSSLDVQAALHGLGGTTSYAAGPSTPVAHGAPGFDPSDPLKLTAGMSSLRRGGRWDLPPYLRVHAVASSVRLDLVDAVALADVVDMEVRPGAASVRLIVPAGWGVDADRLGRGVGSVKVRVPGRPDPGCPLIVVRGSIGAGSFKVTGPSRRQLRRRA
jgi:hypothetical protein